VAAPPAPPPPASAAEPDPALRADHAARTLLAYSDRLRSLAPADLAQELARPPVDPLEQPGVALEQALALAGSRNPGDLARALALLDPLVASRRPALAPWQPLARLLQGRLADQRRLEEAGERQAQQLRDQQRRIEQLSSQLEALKAIERSLNTRPPGSAGSAAPGGPPAARAP
ncbi:MAG: hypothetical protein KGL50_03775, partial [Burkholderiales bacterium]|nr:hypothetical protein [Burkholderiales bacterium]